MADIVRRPEYPVGEWEPFRIMREMFRDPFFREMTARGLEQAWLPNFEVRENGSSLRIVADVPGIKREDIDITLTGHRIVISGRREAEQRSKDEQLHTYERSFGEFTRSFTLPDYVDVEHITSDLRDGVLTIAVPKRAGEKARKIQIGGAATTKA